MSAKIQVIHRLDDEVKIYSGDERRNVGCKPKADERNSMAMPRYPVVCPPFPLDDHKKRYLFENTKNIYKKEKGVAKMRITICRLRRILVVAFLSITLSACGAGDDLADLIVPTQARTIHLSPDTPDVDVEYELADEQAIYVGLAYREATDYTTVRTWSSVTFTNSSGDEIASLNDPGFGRDTYNTIYLVNRSNALEIIHSQDDRSTNPSKTKVRFVHACADGPAVDVKTDSSDETALFANTAFKGITAYKQVDPGSYTFVITEAGNTVDAMAEFEPVTLSANKNYTIVILGTLDEMDAYDLGVTIFDDTGSGDQSVDLDR